MSPKGIRCRKRIAGDGGNVDERAKAVDGRSLVGSHIPAHQTANDHGREPHNDRHDDEQLDEREPALFFLLVIIIRPLQSADENVPDCKEGHRTAMNVKMRCQISVELANDTQSTSREEGRRKLFRRGKADLNSSQHA
jgi:hypothetical protein